MFDLGCGSGEFLISRVRQHPQRRGIGVDVASAACELARENVEKAGLSGRIQIIQADAKAAADHTNDKADLVCLKFCLHDLVSADASAFSNVVELMRPGGRIVIAEVEPASSASTSCFRTGFAWLHSLMGQRLLRQDEWARAFKSCGLRILGVATTGMPGAFIMHAELEGGRYV